jgi:hypothetical protein
MRQKPRHKEQEELPGKVLDGWEKQEKTTYVEFFHAYGRP